MPKKTQYSKINVNLDWGLFARTQEQVRAQIEQDLNNPEINKPNTKLLFVFNDYNLRNLNQYLQMLDSININSKYFKNISIAVNMSGILLKLYDDDKLHSLTSATIDKITFFINYNYIDQDDVVMIKENLQKFINLYPRIKLDIDMSRPINTRSKSQESQSNLYENLLTNLKEEAKKDNNCQKFSYKFRKSEYTALPRMPSIRHNQSDIQNIEDLFLFLCIATIVVQNINICLTREEAYYEYEEELRKFWNTFGIDYELINFETAVYSQHIFYSSIFMLLGVFCINVPNWIEGPRATNKHIVKKHSFLTDFKENILPKLGKIDHKMLLQFFNQKCESTYSILESLGLTRQQLLIKKWFEETSELPNIVTIYNKETNIYKIELKKLKPLIEVLFYNMQQQYNSTHEQHIDISVDLAQELFERTTLDINSILNLYLTFSKKCQHQTKVEEIDETPVPKTHIGKVLAMESIRDLSGIAI